MITLLPSDKIQVQLGESASTQLDCYTSLTERGTGVKKDAVRHVVRTNNTNVVDIVDAPTVSNVQRLVDSISIYNNDSVLHNVTILFYAGNLSGVLWKGSVPSGGKLEYEDKKGWNVYGNLPFGYCINVQALTSSPADSTTYYIGMKPIALTSTAGANKIYIRKAGTIKIAEIYTYAGTAGTAEQVAMYVRKNNTTDTLIQSVAVSANERIFTNSSLSIPVAVGDYLEIKMVCPAWATNPLTFILGGYIYIE